jgi:hypothetical protein
MSLGFNSVSHSFEVAGISIRGVPVPSPVFNEFDYFGTLLGLKRLPEEKNDKYKTRLLDVFTHRASSTYTGLVNGITRELGLSLFKPVTIRVRTDIDPTWSPRIEFVDNVIYIWKDVATQLLDITIERSPVGTEAYFIGGLVDAINGSSVFTATLNSSDYEWLRGDCIVNQSSSKLVEQQPLISSKKNFLGIGNIDKTSVVFSDSLTFAIEVNSPSLLTSAGKYYINYKTGLIQTFSIPDVNAFIQYSYLQDPFVPVASEVIIRPFNTQEFQTVLFNQIVQPDGTTTNATPTALGAEIINELLSVVPMYWGE